MSASIWSPGNDLVPPDVPPEYVYKQIWFDITETQTVIDFSAIDTAFSYTPGTNSLQFAVDGLGILQPTVDYIESSTSSITLIAALGVPGRGYAVIGRPLNVSTVGIDAALIPYTAPDGTIKSVQDLSGVDGTDLIGGVKLPSGAAAPYLQTLSEIINGNAVSIMRFINPIYHSSIRDRTSTVDLKTSFEDMFTSEVDGVTVPYGRFCISPVVASDLTFFSLKGESRFAAQIALLYPGVALTFSNLQQGVIEGLEFVPLGTLAASSGMLLNDRTGTTTVANCGFTGFKLSGLQAIGTLTDQLSGNMFSNNLFLANEGSQFYSQYNNDWWIENNQFGWTGGVHPAIGCELVNSGQGTYAHNFHWENVVDLKATNCGGNRYVNNRIEESTHEGVIFTGCFHQTFALNRLYANSKGNANLYDAIVLVGESESIFEGNDVYDWTGGSNPRRYSYNIDSTSTDLTWKNNKSDLYCTAPYAPLGVSALTLNADDSPSWNGGSITAGTFNWIGPAGRGATPAEAQTMAGRRCYVVGYYFAVTSAPGVGQSIATQLYKNGAAIGGAVATVGAAAFTAQWVGTPVAFDRTDQWCVYSSPTGGAATAVHTVRLIVIER